MFDLHNIIKEWKNEAHVKHTVCWGYEYRDDGIALVICTDRPGAFIGFRGERHERFASRIIEGSKKSIRPITAVRYLESRGIC